MKKFLIRVLFITVPLLILLALFECSLRRIPNPYLFKDELMSRKAMSVKTLIIGSSVADYGIFPAYLGDSAYSLAISGEWIKYNEASLMRFIDDMPHLKTIFWGICFQVLWKDDDYTGVFVESEEIGDETHKAEQCIYRGFTLGNHNPFYKIECIQNFPVAMEKWKKHYILRQPTVRCDSLGFDYTCALSKRSSNWKMWEQAVKSHSVDVHKNVCNVIYRMNCKRMSRVAHVCKEKGIRLCLIVPPTHSLYYTHVGSEQLQLMYDALNEVCRKYENVLCLDYFKDSRFIDDDFYDVNHLSDVGAKKFTRILVEEIPEKWH